MFDLEGEEYKIVKLVRLSCRGEIDQPLWMEVYLPVCHLIFTDNKWENCELPKKLGLDIVFTDAMIMPDADNILDNQLATILTLNEEPTKLN